MGEETERWEWGITLDRTREEEEEETERDGRKISHRAEREKERERERRRRAAHNGLILTFLSGPGLPVSFQMNGNCPAGFNHVLNWQKNRRKALLRQLRIDRSGSRPIATPLYPPISQKHTLADTHTPQTYMRAPMSEQRTEALITATSRWKRGQKTRGGVGENGGGEKVEQWGAGSHLGFRVSAVAGDWEEDNCFIKGVIAITSLILQRTKHLLPFVSHLASWLQSDKAIHRSLLSSS